MDGGEDSSDRRQSDDRRERGAGAGRRGAANATSPLTFVVRSLGAVFLLVVVIVFTVRSMRPVFATRGTLGDELRRRAPGVAKAIAAGDSTDVDQFMATAKFQEEKRNFYEDVMRLKQVDSARADSIAQYAVREAYKRGISPAIVFGVMLTENARFISKATSNVGAVGLMQVYPKVWLNKEMTALFGHDLASDSTNVKYGVFILSHYFNPKTKAGVPRERDWATALLRYNGCVKGTNTPRCHTYPSKVKNFVENQATSICDGRGFYECIAKPFIEGLFGPTTTASGKAPSTTPMTGAAVQTSPATSAPTGSAPLPVPPAAAVVTAAPVAPAAPVAVATKPPERERAATKRPTKSSKVPRATASRRTKAAAASKSKATRRRETAIPTPPKRIEIKVP